MASAISDVHRSIIGTTVPAVASNWKPDWLMLTVSAAIGLSGVLLSDVAGAVEMKYCFSSAFALSLASFTVLKHKKWRQTLGAAAPPVHALTPVRQLSRQIYLLLYLLAAAKEMQCLLRARDAELAFSESMHGLAPYILGALISLIAIRRLAYRTCA
jgi:hypothetical protein